MKKVFVLVVILLLLSSCSLFQRSCLDQSEEFLDSLNPLFSAWDDANEIANSTSRIALSGPLSNLQSIRRQVAELDHPDCAYRAYSTALAYMDASIDGYLAFMSDESETSIQSHFSLADMEFDNFLAAVEKMKQTP